MAFIGSAAEIRSAALWMAGSGAGRWKCGGVCCWSAMDQQVAGSVARPMLLAHPSSLASGVGSPDPVAAVGRGV